MSNKKAVRPRLSITQQRDVAVSGDRMEEKNGREEEWERGGMGG